MTWFSRASNAARCLEDRYESSQVHLGVGDAMHSRLDDNVPGCEGACKESDEVDNSAHSTYASPSNI